MHQDLSAVRSKQIVRLRCIIAYLCPPAVVHLVGFQSVANAPLWSLLPPESSGVTAAEYVEIIAAKNIDEPAIYCNSEFLIFRIANSIAIHAIERE